MEPRMRTALALATLTFAGCIAGPGLSQHSTDNLHEMRADLRACTLGEGAWAYALIPDFGITADHKRVKCMRERGWEAGPERSAGIRDYARFVPASAAPSGSPVAIDTSCPPGTVKDGQGCRYDVAPAVEAGPALTTTAEPAWATGE
jgi:hypothetical protein